MDTTSTSLLERLRQPDAGTAWDRFVYLYTPLLYHWARGRGLQEADASDLVKDVLVVLIRKLPEFQYDRQKSFRGWLRSIVLNRWRDKQRGRVDRRLEYDEAAQDLLVVPDDAAVFAEAEYQGYLV